MYREDEYLLLSGIQHFAFCRRQWALIHIEGQWAENELTVGGQLVHERVHDSSLTESRGNEIIVRGMPIKSESMGASGTCDAVVFTAAEEGVALHGREGLWRILPVEYKHGKSKTDNCDRLQAAAQAMCLEEMFCCNIRRTALYYHETHSREYIDVTEELRETVKASFEEMHGYFRRGYTPHAKTGPYCQRCSLKEICLPRLMKTGKSAAEYVAARITEGAS